jgi:hypothetical protein
MRHVPAALWDLRLLRNVLVKSMLLSLRMFCVRTAGMDLYFKRHDGCAVTCDDFLAAMADANGVDLTSLAAWYAQAGTPRVEVAATYDAGQRLCVM